MSYDNNFCIVDKGICSSDFFEDFLRFYTKFVFTSSDKDAKDDIESVIQHGFDFDKYEFTKFIPKDLIHKTGNKYYFIFDKDRSIVIFFSANYALLVSRSAFLCLDRLTFTKLNFHIIEYEMSFYIVNNQAVRTNHNDVDMSFDDCLSCAIKLNDSLDSDIFLNRDNYYKRDDNEHINFSKVELLL